MQAIIDLGTNIFHLLIAEVKDGIIYEKYQKQIGVKIGEGGINNGKITPEAFERGMQALEQFSKTIRSFQIEKTTAIATSAIRNAANGDDFIKAAYDRFNFSISAISGKEEADLIFRGVSESFDLPDENVLIMDIGGGSVEFILAKKDIIYYTQSFEIGTTRLFEKFKPSNPIEPKETKAIITYLGTVLLPLSKAIYEHPVKKLVGSAGCFETLVDVFLKDFQITPISVSKNADSIPKNLFGSFYHLMVGSNQNQRSRLQGLIPFRIEMIVVATVLINYCVETFQIEEIIASRYALKEGILFANS